ncbi:hypothetical protein RHMOL_Rhmol04G0093300 [Rhododendron molle]|uniref:Uncharacterized protein n=1 Tax=Rhododendron molle TaxID=49168 RepID=A0ACC0NZR0_RHOML|nr:hypothetical protein RHMOL_Rhmol04G0093300 [Rhododendron molle]
MLKPSSSFSPPPTVSKAIWNLKVQPKIKHFWWRACQNLLAARDNLHRRIIPGARSAKSTTNSQRQLNVHMLFGCEWTHAMWFGCEMNFRVDLQKLTSVMQWTVDMLECFPDRNEFPGKAITIGW